MPSILNSRSNGRNPVAALTQDRMNFSGTAIIDNISYSGADIKIVIHRYNAGSNAGSDIPGASPGEMQNIDVTVDELRRKKAGLEAREAEQKPMTQGMDYIRSKLRATDKAINSWMDKAIGIRQEQSEAVKDKNKAGQTKVLAEAQTLSISTYREKIGVRSLGSVYPKGFTRGPRQIAGSIIFTVFDKDVFYDILEAHPSDIEASTVTSAVLDQLPPVDIIVTFANEMGALSRMSIYGVEFMSSGIVFSIEDIISENTVQWVARDYDPMRTVALPVYDSAQNALYQNMGVRASSLLQEEDYKDIRNAISPFERFKRRRNPFQ